MTVVLEMLTFPISLGSHPPLFQFPCTHPIATPTKKPNPTITSKAILLASPTHFLSKRRRYRSSNHDSTLSSGNDGDGDYSLEMESDFVSADGVHIEIEKLGNNSRRIRSKIAIDASLPTVWNILTDYERLADFIPGLALSQLIERRNKFARLYQIGEQNLAFGVKFNAKGTVDCYEKDVESLPFCKRRDIEFEMIEGDFEVFAGRWSIEQYNSRCQEKEFDTTLWYVVDVKPKLWLPVGLVEGRLCREIKMNLQSIRHRAILPPPQV